ncbi:MAG: DUF2817 domain-containing protein [Methylococcaceae bacterium]|nr:DUF2817 domain-containing protein [Methylococcaceae bacterium]
MASYLTYSPIDVNVFPPSYQAARSDFLSIAEVLNGKHNDYSCPGKTPDGKLLFTDTLWLGSDSAEKVFVLLAGTHGVEGLAGSAIEQDFLRLFANREIKLPENTAVLIVHALTPWGFAWLRRCDEDGVDLNRNAVDFSQSLPENPGYELLKNALFSVDGQQRTLAFAEFERQQGRTAFEVAVSGGQYSDPAGPFYGGNKPAHGRIVTEHLIRQHCLNERDLAVIDLHSGLGPYGYGEIICDHSPDSAGVRVAQNWYGDSVTLPALGTSSSVPKNGLIDYLWHRIMNERSCHVTLEFGTFSTDRLFEVIVKDHQLWAQHDNTSARLAHSKLMRQHFCPGDPFWKASVLFRARQVITQALHGLSS